MKKTAIFVLVAFFAGSLILPNLGFANGSEKAEIQKPLLLPTSPFYFIKEVGRAVQTFLTFNAEKKAELKLKIADEKLTEAKIISEEQPQNQKALEKALQNYVTQRNELKGRLEKLANTSKNPNIEKLVQRIDEKIIAHEELFDELTSKNISAHPPLLIVTNPMAGEKWVAGNSHFIKWNATSSIKSVNIYLARHAVVVCHSSDEDDDDEVESTCPRLPPQDVFGARQLIAQNVENKGYYLWQIPLDINNVPESGITVQLPKARIFIESSDKSLGAYSRVFSIISANALTSETITGFLEASGPSFQMWGTHRLKVEESSKCLDIVGATCPPVIERFYLVKAANDNVLAELKNFEGKIVSIRGEVKYYDIEGGFWGIVAESVDVGLRSDSNRKPSAIKIISPKAGDKWIQGKTYQIKWAGGGDKVNIVIEKFGDDTDEVALWEVKNIPNKGFYDFFASLLSGRYRFVVYTDRVNYTYSDYFEIVSPVSSN